MDRKTKQIALIINLIFILIFQLPTGLNVELLDGNVLSAKKQSNYDIQAPIYIDGNFSATASSKNWTGLGTQGDPFIVENISISGDVNIAGITILNSADFFVIRDSEITGMKTAINILNVQNGIIENITVTSNYQGIYLDSSSINISDSTFLSNIDPTSVYASAIYAKDSSVLISGNSVTSNEYGIDFSGTMVNTSVSDNDILNNLQYGIHSLVSTGSDILIKNNVITYTTYAGIDIRGSFHHVVNNSILNYWQSGITMSNSLSTDNIIENNTIIGYSSTSYYQRGIYIYSSATNNHIRYNSIGYSNDKGISLWSTSGNYLYNNTIVNSKYGFHIKESSQVLISNNSIQMPLPIFSTGVVFDNSHDSFVTNNNFFNFSFGIDSISSSSNNSVLSNSFNGSGTGIRNGIGYLIDNNSFINSATSVLLSDSFNRISNNQLKCLSEYSSYNGILLYAGDNEVLNNSITNCDSGVYFRNSPNNNVSGNSLINSSFNFWKTSNVNELVQNFASNNTVNGGSVVYYASVDQVSSVNYETVNQLIIVNSTNVDIKNKVSTGHRNVLSYFSQNVSISNSTFETLVQEGMILFYSSNHSLNNNSFLGGDYGISLINSMHVNITNSQFFSMNNPVKFDASSNNTFTNNSVNYINSYSVWVTIGSDYNIIENNSLISLGIVNGGVHIVSSNSNTIRNNQIISSSFGIRLISSTLTLIDNNNIIGESASIYHSQSSGTTIINNINKGSIRIETTTFDHIGSLTMTNNIVDNRPLLFVKNQNNTVISGNNAQIIVVNSTFITISDQNLFHSYEGVSIFYSSNITLRNSTFSNLTDGLRIIYSDDTLILNNTFSNIYSGVYATHSDSLIIQNNTLKQLEYGLKFDNSIVGLVTQNKLENTNSHAIHVSLFDQIIISNNHITSSNQSGIYLVSSSMAIINNNAISNTLWHGIYIYSAPNFSVINNTVSFSNQSGLYVYNVQTGKVINSTFVNNTDSGIYIYDPNFNPNYYHLEGNLLADNLYGVHFIEVEESNISDNLLIHNKYGIFFEQSTANSITGNQFISQTNYSVYLLSSSNNNFLTNDFINNNNNQSNGYSTLKNHFTFNYYSDWLDQTVDSDSNGILDQMYTFDGPGGDIDLYPLADSFYNTELNNDSIQEPTIIIETTTVTSIISSDVFHNATSTVVVTVDGSVITTTKTVEAQSSPSPSSTSIPLITVLMAFVIMPVLILINRRGKRY